MRLMEEKDVEKVLQYLRRDLGNCIYLYMDIKKYGLTNPDIVFWINDSEPVKTIVMQYFDSLQIYSVGEEKDLDEIRQIIRMVNAQMISGEKKLLDKLLEIKWIGETYHSKDGCVFQFTNYRSFPYDGIETAKVEDLSEIAELICMDEEFKHNYKQQDLERQLTDRLLTGMGRNYIIRDKGKIIAHIATFAEDDEMAVTSGLIVHPDHRSYPYGAIMESYLVNRLLEEDLQVFTFVHDKKRIKLLRAMRCPECGQYEKLMLMER